MVPVLPGNAAYNALIAADGLTPGSPFPFNATTGTYKIPLNLVDQNIVRELNSGTFPKPNTTCTGTGSTCKQFIISVKPAGKHS